MARPAATGYFPRGESVLRRVHGARIVGVTYGQRALLMQATDPLAFAGLMQDTSGLEAPFRRLSHTAKVMERVFFGTRAQADRETARVRRMHARVRGTLDRTAGRHTAGTPYRADDPEFLLWILACTADSAQAAYERFVRRLADRERERFWADYRLLGELFGLPGDQAPASYREYRDYLRERLHGDDLHITEQAREIGRRVAFRMPLPAHRQPALAVVNLAVVGLLPERVRRLYGIGWDAQREVAMEALASALRIGARVTPARLRRGFQRGRLRGGGPQRGARAARRRLTFMAAPARARLPLWAFLLLALPAAGLAILVAQPRLDVRWEHHPAHFWLVVFAAALNAVLAYATGTAARRRGDARVFLVSLSFLCAAGFLGLHALATPQVLLDAKNAGFSLATPVGLLGAGALAAASSAALTTDRASAVMRRAGALQNGLVAVMVTWAAVSLASLAPLDNPAAPERASGPLLTLAAAGVVLYGVAVVRYLRLYARRPADMLVAFAAAFALLAEAMAAVAIGRNWHATWWEWHALMLVAFGLVAYSAHRQWHEERFSDLYLEDTAAGRREVSVLFADLQGFTHFSETRDPGEVSEMLNTYFQVAIPPVVERHGGTIDRLVGDALMATFNRNGDQPDHVQRAARAALAIQEATARIADEHPDWPRFRVAVNTGEAMVGVVGTAGGRTHTVIGDTVNLAARLEGKAPVGGVAIGPLTRADSRARASSRWGRCR